MDGGRWTVGGGRWAVDGGRWTGAVDGGNGRLKTGDPCGLAPQVNQFSSYPDCNPPDPSRFIRQVNEFKK